MNVIILYYVINAKYKMSKQISKKEEKSIFLYLDILGVQKSSEL